MSPRHRADGEASTQEPGPIIAGLAAAPLDNPTSTALADLLTNLRFQGERRPTV